MAECAEVILIGGEVAFVDEGDLGLVSGHKWFAQRARHTIYAYATINGQRIGMHRRILSPPKGVIVDHRNHNGLDNRRFNIRSCSHAENMRNRLKRSGETASQFKGVIWGDNCWRARIGQNGDYIELGRFDDELEAARQYDRAARVFHGRFALTNEMLGLLPPTSVLTTEHKASRPRVRRDPQRSQWLEEMARLGIQPRQAHRSW